MANPVIRSIKEKVVSIIATNVTTGVVNKHREQGRDFQYLVTYRLTGEAAPSSAEMLDEGVIMFMDNPEQETISNTAAIDIYVYGNDEDGKNEFGKLIVWA